MKRLGQRMVYAFIIVALLGAGLAAYVRLAPTDPDVWHLDMAAPGFQPNPRWAAFCPRAGDRYALTEDPAALLAQLDTVALATPRTTRLAGSVEEGRITWITRSAAIGFPDFTTAQILPDPAGPRLCILGRQRFGEYDWGVNAARISGWVQQVLSLPEPPPAVPF